MYLPIHAEAGLRAAPESAQRHVDDDHDGGGDDGEHRAQVAARLVPGVATLVAAMINFIVIGQSPSNTSVMKTTFKLPHLKHLSSFEDWLEVCFK